MLQLLPSLPNGGGEHVLRSAQTQISSRSVIDQQGARDRSLMIASLSPVRSRLHCSALHGKPPSVGGSGSSRSETCPWPAGWPADKLGQSDRRQAHHHCGFSYRRPQTSCTTHHAPLAGGPSLPSQPRPRTTCACPTSSVPPSWTAAAASIADHRNLHFGEASVTPHRVRLTPSRQRRRRRPAARAPDAMGRPLAQATAPAWVERTIHASLWLDARRRQRCSWSGVGEPCSLLLLLLLQQHQRGHPRWGAMLARRRSISSLSHSPCAVLTRDGRRRRHSPEALCEPDVDTCCAAAHRGHRRCGRDVQSSSMGGRGFH